MIGVSKQTQLVLSGLKEGHHYGLLKELSTVGVTGQVCVRVLYNGSLRDIWVHDTGIRPPAPGGVWLDDLVNHACRRLFASPRGTARSVQGQSYLEFRDWWPYPTGYKVVARIPVEVPAIPDKPAEADVCRVEIVAYPGADEEALLLARVGQQCERKWGPGKIDYPAGRTDRMIFTRLPLSAVSQLVSCRYTILQAGGRQHELLIKIPWRAAGVWHSILTAVGIECRKLFGPGALTYAPEHGEVCFHWQNWR